MDNLLSTAISGLQANGMRVQAAAFNIVNVNSVGFKSQTVSASSAVPGGVTTSVGQSDQPVDMAQEFVGMIEAQAGYGANASVINTASRMTGSLLDILA